MNSSVNNPEKFIWSILKKHFPFLLWELTREDREDINQYGWLAALQNEYNFRDTYNQCQRELYKIAKMKGYRRTHANIWVKREVSFHEVTLEILTK